MKKKLINYMLKNEEALNIWTQDGNVGKKKKLFSLEAPSCGLGGSLQPQARQPLFAVVSSSLIKTGGTTKQRVSTRAWTISEEIPGCL